MTWLLCVLLHRLRPGLLLPFLKNLKFYHLKRGMMGMGSAMSYRQSLTCFLIALLFSLITRQAAEWAAMVLRVDSDVAHSCHEFICQLRASFQGGDRLVRNWAVSKYIAKFRTLAVPTTWGNSLMRTLLRRASNMHEG